MVIDDDLAHSINPSTAGKNESQTDERRTLAVELDHHSGEYWSAVIQVDEPVAVS